MLGHLHRCTGRLCAKKLQIPSNKFVRQTICTPKTKNIVQRSFIISTSSSSEDQLVFSDGPEDDFEEMEAFEELPFEKMDTKDKLASLMQFVVEKPVTEEEVNIVTFILKGGNSAAASKVS